MNPLSNRPEAQLSRRHLLCAGAAATCSLLTGGLVSAVAGPKPRLLQFAGYEWEVRAPGLSDPGPNQWDPKNAWVDRRGRLHLRIAPHGGGWRCAEVHTTVPLGFGRYQFEVIGRLDQLDPNVVLGLFDYPTSADAVDGTNEIDIEFSRWGDPDADAGNYTVYPTIPGAAETEQTFRVQLNGTYTTHRFTRTSTEVLFQSFHGHGSDADPIFNWSFRPADPQTQIPQGLLPVFLNLWLVNGKPPSNRRPVEIIISGFSFEDGVV